jgi:Gly-Xaa carboxypeptidase
MSEKASLPYTAEAPRSQQGTSKRSLRFLLPILALLVPVLYLAHQNSLSLSFPHFSHGCHHRPTYTAAEIDSAKCPAQPPALDIGHHWDPVTDEKYAKLAACRLSKAVQIRTESYDDMPLDPTDERWNKFSAFDDMLQNEFPRVYDALDHQMVNTHGHLYTWKGKDESLQPILLMAHIDTVPVLQDTLGLWRYPPFEGTVTVNGTDDTPGTWIWGRGSSDCKNSLMGILGAVEKLVTEGYTPERTIVLSFGFDEEVRSLSASRSD